MKLELSTGELIDLSSFMKNIIDDNREILEGCSDPTITNTTKKTIERTDALLFKFDKALGRSCGS